MKRSILNHLLDVFFDGALFYVTIIPAGSSHWDLKEGERYKSIAIFCRHSMNLLWLLIIILTKCPGTNRNVNTSPRSNVQFNVCVWDWLHNGALNVTIRPHPSPLPPSPWKINEYLGSMGSLVLCSVWCKVFVTCYVIKILIFSPLFIFQEQNFDMKQEGMKNQLIQLNKLVQVIEPELYGFLRKFHWNLFQICQFSQFSGNFYRSYRVFYSIGPQVIKLRSYFPSNEHKLDYNKCRLNLKMVLAGCLE